MELFAYLTIYIMTMVMIILPGIIKERFFFPFWLLILIGLSVIIRSSIIVGEDSDIGTYIGIMQLEILPSHLFLREFLFYFIIRFLYQLFDNVQMVFVLLDIVIFLFFYKGFKLNQKVFAPNINIETVKYIFFGAFLFFPFVLGMHTVYRQLFATAIFLCAIGYSGQNKLFKAFLCFFASIFIHNVILIFSPILLFVINRPIFKFLSFLSLFSMFLLLNYFLNSESILVIRGSFEAGKTIAYLYLMTLIFIFLLIIMIESMSRKSRYSLFIGLLFMLLIIYGYFTFSISSGGAQRIVFFVFSFIFPSLAFYFEDRFKEKTLMRLIFFHVSISPLFFLHNSTIDISF